jgi:hypothetical protein
MRRRQFITGVSYAALLAAITGKASNGWALGAVTSALKANSEKKRVLIGGLAGEDPQWDPRRMIAGDVPAKLQVLDLKTHQLKSIAMDFTPHSFVQNPTDSYCIAATVKWAKHGGVFDLQKGSLVGALKSPENCRFFGHTAFDEKGYLYATVATNDLNVGSIAVYEPKTWKLVKVIASGGRAPHDIFFIEPGVLLIANTLGSSTPGGMNGVLTWLDVRTGQIKKILPTSRPTHLQQISSHEVVIGNVSSSNTGEFYKVDLNSGQKTDVKDAAHFDSSYLTGEKLSLGVINDHIAAVTTAKGAKVLFWDMKTKSVITKSFETALRGLAVLPSEVLISDKAGALFSVPLDKEGHVSGDAVKLMSIFSNSSHMKLFNL